MALDKQRILNELGSVMNQLKSADCGCMGKIFGNTGQTAAPPSNLSTWGGCRRGCCHGHSYGWNPSGSSGEHFSSNTQNMNVPCMGRCNPPKLYADTYNYLTENLMQPAIKEVYSDLKSLTPANTVVNNPMANQMGLTSQGEFPNEYPTSSQFNVGNINDGSTFNNISSQQPNMTSMSVNEANSNAMGKMGGMGPQIMNMLGGNMSTTNNIMGQKQSLKPMVIDAPQSPCGQVGVTPLSVPMGMNQDINNDNSQGYQNSYHVNQGMVQPNLQSEAITQNLGNTNPASQQMAATHLHGQHSQGIAKFNEMFPGVMKGIGGDLDFDPMAIAIQMNPANHQQAAINTMNKMMQNNDINKVFDQSANAALHSTVVPTSTAPAKIQQNEMQNNLLPNQIQSSPLHQTTTESRQPNITPTGQMMYQNNMNYKNDGTSNAHVNNQQVYHTESSLPVPSQQTHLQPNQRQEQKSLQYQHKPIIDPNTGSIIAPPTFPPVYESVIDHQNITAESPNVQQMIKEPIFPADTSRFTVPKQKYFHYNTLGQPVEMLSAKMYRTPEPALPQTLSPQPTHKSRSDPPKYSKVKSTVSKTSLMGSKPIARTASQLQQIYKQYKGSQSYTQQNIATPAVNVTTHSEGKLIATQNNIPQPQMPVEKIGGDTVVNNNSQNERTNKVEHVMGHIGDVPAANKPVNDEVADKVSPLHNRKTRNGLQDIVYTSYPSSAAWSFHGVNTGPAYAGRRYRKHY